MITKFYNGHDVNGSVTLSWAIFTESKIDTGTEADTVQHTGNRQSLLLVKLHAKYGLL